MSDEENGFESGPEDSEGVSVDAEAQVFAKIVRHLAERLSDVDPDVDPGDLSHTGELFTELADAFEKVGGFEFASDQALPLSHAFVTLEGGMRILAEQATESGHTNAAAKMEWAALKARNMAGKLETHHLEGAGGIIAFAYDDEAEDSIGDPQGHA
ncbi:hypothetical protein ACFL12_01130 [Pseudomonadota bacterium]